MQPFTLDDAPEAAALPGGLQGLVTSCADTPVIVPMRARIQDHRLVYHSTLGSRVMKIKQTKQNVTIKLVAGGCKLPLWNDAPEASSQLWISRDHLLKLCQEWFS